METSSQIEGLQNAVRNIDGLEWLAEMDVDDIDLHDLYDKETSETIKGGRLYILSSNKQATDRLLGLWHQYQKGKKLESDYGKFEKLFPYLITLRRWDIRDRLRDTGILDVWRDEYKAKQNTNSPINFEIQLHYYTNKEKRDQNVQEIQQKIENSKGKVGPTVCIEDIAFHALKASLPVANIEQVVQHNWDTTKPPDNFLPVFNSDAVRHFRPTGQHIDADEELFERPLQRELASVNEKLPVLALLDGAPMLRHNMLDGRIEFFDPDNYISAYEPMQQKHGTAMACLMCHGDLGQSQEEWVSLVRRIYSRPVMKPNSLAGHEGIPGDIFQEDIIERAVREMYEGDDPTAPNVRVINLSIGNIDQHYLNEMSPWARLLDWLTFKYKVLFIVSAGNYLGPIERIDSNDNDDKQMVLKGIDDRENLLRGIDEKQRNHRLLAPAESMNALTVGALQGDASGNLPSSIPNSVDDPIKDMMLPAPYSRVGPGHRGSIKPDIFTQGGRLLYGEDLANTDIIQPVIRNEPPGVQVAFPGAMPEQLDNTAHQAGTSHATAIISHGAGHIFEMLEDIRSDNGDISSSEYDAVLIKTLLIHSASHGENSKAYMHLKNPINKQRIKKYLSRYIGYGNVDIERVLACARTRATAVGCGHIREEARHRFIFPLPASTSVQDYLRLTVTLAWFSPVNPHHLGWRRARLFFASDALKGEHGHKRQEADWQQVRKGTVQHEIFELKKSNLPGNSLEIFVQCTADAGALDGEIPYGLAVTLEIAEQETLNLYQMVKENIRQQIRPSIG